MRVALCKATSLLKSLHNVEVDFFEFYVLLRSSNIDENAANEQNQKCLHTPHISLWFYVKQRCLMSKFKERLLLSEVLIKTRLFSFFFFRIDKS